MYYKLYLNDYISKEDLQNNIRSSFLKPIVNLYKSQMPVFISFENISNVSAALIDFFDHRERTCAFEHITDLKFNRLSKSIVYLLYLLFVSFALVSHHLIQA